MDMLTTGHHVAANGLNDASYSYIGNSLTEMTPKEPLDNCFMRNLKQRSHASVFVNTLTQRAS